MPRKEVHTVPCSKGGWDNKKNGKVVSHHKTKEVAAVKGRLVAKREEAEHIIHNKDGRISQSNSYGNDPNPPKDMK
jgi:hypothetical protein